jgi:peptidoglycan hydrolase-like protein with peptidoglycan-binding domain
LQAYEPTDKLHRPTLEDPMTLEQIANGSAAPVALALVGADKDLARQVQQRLADIGLLDPPVDGQFGAVSQWAIHALLRKLGTPDKAALDLETARALLAPETDGLFPLNTPDTLAGRIVKAIQAEGFWLNRHPDCLNIVYIEGMDPDGKRNVDRPNEFNDLRLLLRVNKAGNPEIAGQWEATTEPGTFYTKIHKLDPRGAARIAFGQYKSWVVGTHNQSKPSGHEALVQCADIKVFRDLNEDFEREGDETFVGIFGINQHWGFDLPLNAVGNASAGCLVGRTKQGHRQFMAALKQDPRYLASRGYRFMTTVLPAQDVVA